jgi:LacI family transcriptional regulator
MAAETPRVALLIESSRTYGRGILRGIGRYAHIRGPWSFFSQERDLDSGIPDWLKSWKGDGIIARIEGRRTAKALFCLGRPVVDVSGNCAFESIPAFDTDARAVAQLAADFFLRSGFRHLAYCGYRGIPFSDRREAAFCQYLAERGHKVRVFSSPLICYPSTHIQAVEQSGLAAEKAIARWLRNQPRPLGLLACNDVRAQQILNACRVHGLKVPEAVAVVGVDNDDVLCGLCEPPLSSIEPDTERLGYAAAELLDKLMKGDKPKVETVQIPPLRVVERASTDIVAIDDPITVQAVRYIRDHVGDGIGVKDVLAHLGRSRTDLEKRFRRWLNNSVRNEIIRRRMDRACSLLRQSRLPVNEVSRAAGFNTTTHLCRLFQRHLRQTPTQYRRFQTVRRPAAIEHPQLLSLEADLSHLSIDPFSSTYALSTLAQQTLNTKSN